MDRLDDMAIFFIRGANHILERRGCVFNDDLNRYIFQDKGRWQHRILVCIESPSQARCFDYAFNNGGSIGGAASGYSHGGSSGSHRGGGTEGDD